jgi:hypothetical protein
MKTKYTQAFYHKLGYLFYSVAAADGSIVKEERDVLHKMVVEDWLDLEKSNDEFGSDNAYQIEVLFDFLSERSFPSERAFEVFEQFFKANLEMFNEDVVDRIYHTSERVASSFHSKNKAELNALTRIHLLLGRERHIL